MNITIPFHEYRMIDSPFRILSGIKQNTPIIRCVRNNTVSLRFLPFQSFQLPPQVALHQIGTMPRPSLFGNKRLTVQQSVGIIIASNERWLSGEAAQPLFQLIAIPFIIPIVIAIDKGNPFHIPGYFSIGIHKAEYEVSTAAMTVQLYMRIIF